MRRHPWEVARAEFFLRVLDRSAVLATARSWLDVGAGDAWFASQLRERVPDRSRLVCWDVNYPPEYGPVDATGLELTADQPPGRFDAILMLDVIEHVEDDRAFVDHILTMSLAPQGRVLVSVPAYMSLYSDHDVALRHFRRYSPRECRNLLQAAGLAIEADGGLFHSLLVARWAEIAVQRTARRAPSTEGVGQWQGGPTPTRAITSALRTEARLSYALSRRGWFLPGLSYWALCSRAREMGPDAAARPAPTI